MDILCSMSLSLIFLVGGFIWLLNWLSDTFSGREIYCDFCNRWYKMKLNGEYFTCTNCGNRINKKRGCPKCAWYSIYGGGFIGRFGPIIEGGPFQSWVYYQEWWNCPRHGKYEVHIPASDYLSTPNYAPQDDYYYDDDNECNNYNNRSNDYDDFERSYQ